MAAWARFAVVRLWVGLVWVVGLLAFLPDVRGPVRAYAGSFMLLAVWFTLARTKTVGWRIVAGVFTASVAWSGVIGWATVTVARGVGLTPAADGSATALAGFLEESGKLVPLIVLAVAAPGRVRRFAATDWAVLGFASGVGFNAFEDALRQTAALVTPVLTAGQWTKDYSLNPWTSATFQTTDGVAVAPGHHLWTSTIAMAIGLAIALWRSYRSTSARGLAVVLPVVVLLVAIAEHAGFNAHNADPRWPATGGEGFPAVLSGLWSATGHGRAIVVLSVVFLVACLLADSHRRHLAALDAIGTGALPPGVVVPGVGTGDGAARWWNARLDTVAPDPTAGRTWRAVRSCGELMIRAVAQGAGDLGIVLAAHTPQRGESRLATVRRARQIATRIRLARSDAMTATTPGTDPGARRRFAITAAAFGILMLVVCVLWGAHIAAAIGPWLNLDADGSFLAGLLDAVGDWWDGLGTGGQILVGAGAAALVVLSGGSLGLAFGIAGVATYGLDKAHGLATFTRNPAQATTDYLATTTPMDFLMDTGEFALTFAPGNFAGAAIARGGRTAVREFLTDPDAFLAARRATMAGDAGVVDLGVFMRREPIELADGTTIRALDASQEASAVARYEGLPTSHVKAQGPARDFQVSVYGENERAITLASGHQVFPDGLASPYGAIGDAKFVGTGQTSFYIPDSMGNPAMTKLAMDNMDSKLADLAEAATAMRGNGVVELTTNNLQAARFIETRMRALDISGYVRILER